VADYILADGFDNYTDPSLKGNNSGNTPGTILTTGGRDGRGCYFGNTGKIGKIVTPVSTIIVGFAVKAQDNTGAVLSIANGVTDLIVVQYRNPYFQIAHAQTGTVYGVASNVSVAPLAWAYIELKFKVSTGIASGDVIMRVNNQVGVTVAAGTSTTWASSTTFNTIWLGSISGAINRFDAYIDDVVLLPVSTGFWGDVVVEGRLPSSDGDLSQWHANGDTPNHNCVDDANPDGDTTYVSSDTLNARDSYKFGPLNQVAAEIKGVQISLMGKKMGAEDLGIVPFTRQGGTNYDQSRIGMTTSYVMSLIPLDTNPATGVAWTPTEIDALEAGQNLTT